MLFHNGRVFEMNIGEVWEINDKFWPAYDKSIIPINTERDFKDVPKGTVFTVIGKLDNMKSSYNKFIEYQILFNNEIVFFSMHFHEDHRLIRCLETTFPVSSLKRLV